MDSNCFLVREASSVLHERVFADFDRGPIFPTRVQVSLYSDSSDNVATEIGFLTM